MTCAVEFAVLTLNKSTGQPNAKIYKPEEVDMHFLHGTLVLTLYKVDVRPLASHSSHGIWGS